MLVTDAVATALTKLGASRHAETPRSGDIPEHWPRRWWGERRNAKRLPPPLADGLDHGVDPGTNSRTSCAQRQATASLPAHSSASSREGTSTTENPPMYALLSGDGPSVTVPSVATTLTSSWEWRPPPKTQTPASFASAPPRALPRPRRGDPSRETSLPRHRTRSDNASSHDSSIGGLLRPHLTLLRTHVQWRPTSQPRTHRSGQIQPHSPTLPSCSASKAAPIPKRRRTCSRARSGRPPASTRK